MKLIAMAVLDLWGQTPGATDDLSAIDVNKWLESIAASDDWMKIAASSIHWFICLTTLC